MLRSLKNTKVKSFLFSNFKNFVKIGKQPGLTRYDWDSQDYKLENYDKSRLTHKTNAEELIKKVPVIEVDDDVVLCYGVGDLAWGHPIEYITLNTRNPKKPNVCKYCGLRYVKKAHDHHNH